MSTFQVDPVVSAPAPTPTSTPMSASTRPLEAGAPKAKPLPPYTRLPTGSIVTLRMAGHSRTEGQEYYAPAIVLAQYAPEGQIAVFILDTTAGSHYNPSYPIRDISSRGTGGERELYVLRENIGQILFDPEKTDQAIEHINALSGYVHQLAQRVSDLESLKQESLKHGGSERITVSTAKP